jgi:hypothetical protein
MDTGRTTEMINRIKGRVNREKERKNMRMDGWRNVMRSRIKRKKGRRKENEQGKKN